MIVGCPPTIRCEWFNPMDDLHRVAEVSCCSYVAHSLIMIEMHARLGQDSHTSIVIEVRYLSQLKISVHHCVQTYILRISIRIKLRNQNSPR